MIEKMFQLQDRTGEINPINNEYISKKEYTPWLIWAEQHIVNPGIENTTLADTIKLQDQKEKFKNNHYGIIPKLAEIIVTKTICELFGKRWKAQLSTPADDINAGVDTIVYFDKKPIFTIDITISTNKEVLGEKLERTADRNKKGGVKLEYIDSHTKNKNTKLPRIVLKIHRHNVINTIKHNNIRVSTMNHILSILYKQLSYFYRVNPANPSIPKDIDKKEKEHWKRVLGSLSSLKNLLEENKKKYTQPGLEYIKYPTTK